MNEFKKYNKIHALHKAESDGILVGKCHIQEKLDGANASIWMHKDGTIHVGSRNNDLTQKVLDGKEISKEFVALLEYVDNHKGIQEFLKNNPDHRLYGEWLVRHTIGYNESAYKEFYLFDIEYANYGFNPIEYVYTVGEQYGIKTPHYHGLIENPTLDLIKELAGQSTLGEKGEGVVIKNPEHVNKFMDKTYAKYVTEDFKEGNSITFGGNNKHSDAYDEMYFVNELVNLPRVRKICNKVQSEHGRLEMRHIPMIMGMTHYDVLTEEIHAISKRMSKKGAMFDFKKFKQLCERKTKRIFIEILEGDISVAHRDATCQGDIHKSDNIRVGHVIDEEGVISGTNEKL